MSGAVTVRRFAVHDLAAAARFCDAARALDPAIEPFAQRLGPIAAGQRAALDLWRVASGEDGGLYGVSFAALRESGPRPVYDFYAAVHPSLRRQGLGRALAEPALASGTALRARVRDGPSTGAAFLSALGFSRTAAELVLQRSGDPPATQPSPALRIRPAGPRDRRALEALSNDAWAGAPDAFVSRGEEIAQLFASEGRLLLLAESGGAKAGYLSAVRLGAMVGIEEVAVLPEFRRAGIARALISHALAGATEAVLSVGESNYPARALYRSLGFRQVGRRLVMERPATAERAG